MKQPVTVLQSMRTDRFRDQDGGPQWYFAVVALYSNRIFRTFGAGLSCA
jgi:hypothetical protein